MPYIMSGIGGGLKGRRTNPEIVKFTIAVLSGEKTHKEIEEYVRQHTFDRRITFVINNSCNLSCRHCYLQVESLTAQALDAQEWDKVFRSALRQNPDLVCLCGKEIFLGNAGADALVRLTELKRSLAVDTRIGAITNGTLLHRHQAFVEQADLDYLDISFDGGKEAHDKLRGEGSFAKASVNAKWAVATLGRRLFAGLTVQRENFQSMRAAVTEITGLGIQTIGCGFYQKVPYSDESLALSDAEFDQFFQSLGDLADIQLHQPTTLLFDIYSTSLGVCLAFMRSRWFAPDRFLTDERGEVFNEHLLPNGLRLQFSFIPYPMTIFKSARITPEGNYLAAEDTLDTRFYPDRTLGNVRDFDFDLDRLHEHARNHPRVSRIFADHSENILPQIQEAFAIHTMLARSPKQVSIPAVSHERTQLSIA